MTMHRTRRTVLIATSIVALLVTAGQAQQRGRGGAPGAPAIGGRGGAPAGPPLMQARPKPVVANAKPVRSCESLASVALPNTTIESATVDANSPLVAKYKGRGSTDDAANFECGTGF